MLPMISFRHLMRGSSSQGSNPRFSQGPLRRLPWPVMLIGGSILLALLGSINIGYAFGNLSTQTTRTETSAQKQALSSQAKNVPAVGSTPTKKSTPPPMPTPTQVETPAPTSVPPVTVQPGSSSASGPMLVVSDNFARKDQDLWGNAPNGFAWRYDAPVKKIFSIGQNEGVITNANKSYDAVIGPQMTNAMVLMSATTNCVSRTTISALLRWQDQNNWYKAYIDGNVLGIRKFVGGQVVIQRTVPFIARQDISYTLRFRVVNSTLSASVWQTGTPEPANWMLKVIDNNNTFSPGQGGIRVGVGENTAIHVTSFAEFSD